MCLLPLGLGTTEGRLATVLAPAVKARRSPLDNLAETLVIILGLAVVVFVRGADLASHLDRRRVLDLQHRLASLDVCLEVGAKGPALLVGVAVATARLENGKVERGDEVGGDLGGVLLADEKGLTVLGLDGVGVFGEILEVGRVVGRLKLEACGVTAGIPLPGVDVVGIDGVAANLGGQVEASLHDVENTLVSDVDVELLVIVGV